MKPLHRAIGLGALVSVVLVAASTCPSKTEEEDGNDKEKAVEKKTNPKVLNEVNHASAKDNTAPVDKTAQRVRALAELSHNVTAVCNSLLTDENYERARQGILNQEYAWYQCDEYTEEDEGMTCEEYLLKSANEFVDFAREAWPEECREEGEKLEQFGHCVFDQYDGLLEQPFSIDSIKALSDFLAILETDSKSPIAHISAIYLLETREDNPTVSSNIPHYYTAENIENYFFNDVAPYPLVYDDEGKVKTDGKYPLKKEGGGPDCTSFVNHKSSSWAFVEMLLVDGRWNTPIDEWLATNPEISLDRLKTLQEENTQE